MENKYNKIISLKFTRTEGVALAQILMEAIDKRTFASDNVNVKWLWMLMETLAGQMWKDKEDGE